MSSLAAEGVASAAPFPGQAGNPVEYEREKEFIDLHSTLQWQCSSVYAVSDRMLLWRAIIIQLQL